MSTIQVFVYGFKSKGLSESVKTMLHNQSGQNEISVVVYDQTNLNRNEKFDGVEYNHLQWDGMVSKFKYLKDKLSSCNKDYFLYIDGEVFLERNWDLELVMGHGGRDIVISGNHAVEFDQSEYKFYT